MPRPKTLKMAQSLTLPQNAVTQTLAYIARKGAGKTYAAGKFVEGLYGLKLIEGRNSAMTANEHLVS